MIINNFNKIKECNYPYVRVNDNSSHTIKYKDGTTNGLYILNITINTGTYKVEFIGIDSAKVFELNIYDSFGKNLIYTKIIQNINEVFESPTSLLKELHTLIKEMH